MHTSHTEFSIFGSTSGAISALPLAFILVASAIKDGIEDHCHRQLDEEVNMSSTTQLAVQNPNIPKAPQPQLPRHRLQGRAPLGSQSTLNMDNSDEWSMDGRSVTGTDLNFHVGAAQWEGTLWRKLKVGNIVLLWDNEQVPADIIVLATSDPDGNCYLEMKNLDGETNLKA
ncbi:hypothetical protein B0H14DRAFT_3476679 [Mycena olivaceomarginata]|nr:hypothetical protein B0H14DRAFT_3476679 [Mycena olivaceomarginata]